MLTRRQVLLRLGGAALAPAAAALSGCRSEPRDGRVHIRYMAWGNPQQHETEQRVIDRFHEQNPDIRVTLFKVPGSAYRNKMIVMLASRTAPDVIRVDQYDFPQLARREYFRDLSPFIAAESDSPSAFLADFLPQALGECMHDGRLHALNVLFGGVIVYYNRTLVEKEGLQEPAALCDRGEWTWDALREYARRMTQRSPNGRVSQFGFSLPVFVNHAPILWAYGADILSEDRKACLLDSPEAVAAYRFLMNLRWKDNVCPTPAQAAQSAFVFESGKLGMTFGWMGETPRLRETVRSFDWDVCPLPAGPKGQFTVVKGNQLVMSANTRHPEAAWRFMKHFVSPETEMFLYGRLRRATTTRYSVMADPEFLRADRPPLNTRTFLCGQSMGRRLPIGPRWQEWSVVRERHLERLYNSPLDPADVLPEMKREIEAVLRSEEGF